MHMTLVAIALLLLAVALVAVGAAGLTDRLPRNRWLGIRSEILQHDDEAWRVGHHAAGSVLMTAAGLPLLLGIALLASPPDDVADWLLVYAGVGLVTGGLIALAVRRADRAAHGPTSDERPPSRTAP